MYKLLISYFEHSLGFWQIWHFKDGLYSRMHYLQHSCLKILLLLLIVKMTSFYGFNWSSLYGASKNSCKRGILWNHKEEYTVDLSLSLFDWYFSSNLFFISRNLLFLINLQWFKIYSSGIVIIISMFNATKRRRKKKFDFVHYGNE